MQNSLTILEWDSSFFGYPIGKIEASSISEKELSGLVKEAKGKNIHLIYLFTNPHDQESIRAAKKADAKLVDQKVTFSKEINGSGSLPETENHIREFESPVPTEQLIKLAIQSGLYSRYKLDSGFKNNEFEKLYSAWITNSVNKQLADHNFVYVENSRELGVVTLKLNKTTGQIGLIAVDEHSRGKSIGKKLINAVVNKISEKNIHHLDVATQLNNNDACKFYEKLGFNITRTENIYHIWL